MTQYIFPAEQWERVLMSSAVTRIMEGVDQSILTENCFIAVLRKIEYIFWCNLMCLHFQHLIDICSVHC